MFFFNVPSDIFSQPNKSTSKNLDDTSTHFVTVKLNGQLGNQLFEIATAYAYALDHNLTLTIPDLKKNSEYNIPHNAKILFLPKISAEPPKKQARQIWKEPDFCYTPIPSYKNVELNGWFQSEKYFAHRRKELLDLFKAPEGMNYRILERYPFLSSNQLVVGVQIRDYRVEKHIKPGEYHPTIGRSYYEKAVKNFPKDTIFLVSSNNSNFAKECMEGLSSNIIYLKEDYIEEFFTLVLCQSFIISNSSFGWWAAWLSQAENKKVFVPNTWFAPPYNDAIMKRDLIPNYYEVIN